MMVIKSLIISIGFWVSSLYCQAQQNGKLHFRLSGGSSAPFTISIDKNDANIYRGSVLIHTKEYMRNEKEKQTNRTYQEEFSIDSSAAIKIIKLYQTLKIGQIPEWRSGDDGEDYTIEFTDDQVSFYNKYWSPYAINTDNARTVLKYIDTVKSIASMKHLMSVFSKHVPFECYDEDSIVITCKALSKKLKRKYKAERDAYRKAHNI